MGGTYRANGGRDMRTKFLLVSLRERNNSDLRVDENIILESILMEQVWRTWI